MKKKVNYKEFLEIVSIDLIEKYSIELNPNKTMVFGTNQYVSLQIGNVKWYAESDDTWTIRTKKMWVTFWKKVDYVHISEML